MADANCNTSRRWFQFGLRSVFVLTLVIAAYFAGWRSAQWKAELDKEEPPVQGTVNVDDRPLKHGTIEFVGDSDPKRNKKASIRDGKFSVPGDQLPPGRYRIVIQPEQNSAASDVEMSKAKSITPQRSDHVSD